VPQALSLDPATTSTPPAEKPPVTGSIAVSRLPTRRGLPRRSDGNGYGRKLGIVLFTTLSGALAFSLLTEGGRQTRAVTSFLPESEKVLYWTGLRIEQVSLSGQRFTPDADVFDAIDLPNAGSLLMFDANAARARIEALPWVASATINRAFPAALEVRITERRPTALWLHENREQLIDSSGRVLGALKMGTRSPLPRVSGEGAPAQAQSLLDLVVRFPRIAERFQRAERVGDRRWTLHLKDNVTVHLGADREAVALAALSSPDELGLLLTAHDVVVDLRTRGRVTVRPSRPAAASAKIPPTQS
jgi:cell division protein FtsQ